MPSSRSSEPPPLRAIVGRSSIVTSDGARQQILSRLHGNSRAQRLAEAVSAFYGDRLQYIEREDVKNSSYGFSFERPPSVRVDAATITVRLGTDRLPEALVHELLHLELPTLGFPVTEGFEVPDPLEDLWEHFAETLDKTGNLVQHDINIARFLELGFDRAKFLGEIAGPPVAAGPYAGALEIPFWSLEYFRQWISTRHIHDPRLAQYARLALERGSTRDSALRDRAVKMQNWVQNGLFSDPANYARQFDHLIALMEVPVTIKWVRIARGASGAPELIRV